LIHALSETPTLLDKNSAYLCDLEKWPWSEELQPFSKKAFYSIVTNDTLEWTILTYLDKGF